MAMSNSKTRKRVAHLLCVLRDGSAITGKPPTVEDICAEIDANPQMVRPWIRVLLDARLVESAGFADPPPPCGAPARRFRLARDNKRT